MNKEQLKKEIDKIGNIKVVFEPDVYNDKLIQKNKINEKLVNSKVAFRGWDFPHIPIQDQDDSKRPYSIDGGKEFYTAWEDIYEIFRFYRSGQFLAKLALCEDLVGNVNGKEIEKGSYLDFLSLIYRLTEVVYFVKNLFENIDEINGGKIIIEINNTNNRELESIFSSRVFRLHGGYICRMGKIETEKKFSRDDILTNPLEVAFSLITDIFEDFNWDNYSSQMIRTHQENLINRRI